MADDTPRMILAPPRRRRPAGRPVSGQLGQPRALRRRGHARADPPRRADLPRASAAGRPGSLDGGSTGGWVALALQVFYPDFFNGAWSFCPDSVDFRVVPARQYLRRQERVCQRATASSVPPRATSRARSATRCGTSAGWRTCWAGATPGRSPGGQWGAWNATYGPRGADGRPVPLWDPATGRDRPRGRRALEGLRPPPRARGATGPTLGPKLQGKLHIWVGEADDYLPQQRRAPARRLPLPGQPRVRGLDHLRPRARATAGWGSPEREMMKQMARRVAAPPASQDSNPGD